MTRKRVEQLQAAGRRFNWIEAEYWWHLEALQFLKSRSRAISLIDYKAEKEFVDRVSHQVLLSVGTWPSHQLTNRRNLLGDAIDPVTALSETGAAAVNEAS